MELVLFLLLAFIVAGAIATVVGVSLLKAAVIGVIGLALFYIGGAILKGVFAVVVGGISVIGGAIFLIIGVIIAIYIAKKMSNRI